MKLKRPLIAAVFMMLSSSCWQEGGKTTYTTVVSYLPQIQADFSDLDVRDAQNHAVSSTQAIGELVLLFRENAVDLLVRATPPVLHEMYSLIDAFTHLFKDTFYTVTRAGLEQIQTAYFTGIRRVVHNVHNLWITLSDGTSIGWASGTLLTLSRKPQKLYLRC
jgi:hypothetical protein